MSQAVGPGPEAIPVLDREKTLERLKDDEEFLLLLYATFLEDLPQRRKSFEEALASEDISGLNKLAHSLKGAAATIDACRVREIALEMELAAKAGDLPATSDAQERLRKEVDTLETALNTALGR